MKVVQRERSSLYICDLVKDLGFSTSLFMARVGALRKRSAWHHRLPAQREMNRLRNFHVKSSALQTRWPGTQ